MWWLIATLVVALLGAALWGPIVSNVEQPKYQVVESSGNIEIRDYAAVIVAETEVAGDRRDAIGKGFRIIADYIFGNNTVAQKVPMKNRRMGKGLSFSHHQEVAQFDDLTKQKNWLVRAEEGDEGIPWSAKRLRKEIDLFKAQQAGEAGLEAATKYSVTVTVDSPDAQAALVRQLENLGYTSNVMKLKP